MILLKFYLNLRKNFRIVNYAECNKDEYFTISLDGVCHYCAKEEIEYTTLDRWEQEYKLYLKLIKVNRRS